MDWFSKLHSTGEQPLVTWAILKRVLGYGQPYLLHISGMLITILVSAGLMLVNPIILRELIDYTIPAGDVPRLAMLVLALLVIPAIQGMVTIVQTWLNSIVGEGVTYDLRVALFSQLQKMSLRFFINTKGGELMSRLNNDVTGARNAISNTIVGIITNMIETIAILGIMLALEWRLTLFSVLILPLFLLAARFLGKRLSGIARQHLELNAQMNAQINEALNIGGALLVKLFGRQVEEEARLRERAADVRDAGIRSAVLGIVFIVVIGLVSAVSAALVYGIGGYLVIEGAFTIGTIVAFGTYLVSLYRALQGLANTPVEFAISMVSFERVFEVIDLPLEIYERPGAAALTHVKGELVFRNIWFKYTLDEKGLLSDVRRHGRVEAVTSVLSPASKNVKGARCDGMGEFPLSQTRAWALEDISFRAERGQVVALVGPSGAGKTTLTYLIPRLYDPTRGCILLDGHDLRDVAINSLSAHVGMVTQESYLFHDTILANMLFANPNASELEIESAARAANIHDFIIGLPERYNTIVGERGYRLSGGEKQRIALARVILKSPQILVLDEATSHLDSESESLIQQTLKRVMQGRTCIVIAHRLSTILDADLILVMDRGRIVEHGIHDELLTLGGLYTRLYKTQFERDYVFDPLPSTHHGLIPTSY